MKRDPNTFWSPYAGGIALGLVLLTTYAIMGKGLGASGASFRAGVAVVHAIAPKYAESVPAMASTGEDGNPLKEWLVFASRIDCRVRGEEPSAPHDAEPVAPTPLG